MSFRRLLLLFALTLIVILAVPLAILEARKPWQELYRLIDRSRVLIGGLTPAFEEEDLRKMAGFALRMAPVIQAGTPAGAGDTNYATWAHSHAFYLFLDSENRLPEEVDESGGSR